MLVRRQAADFAQRQCIQLASSCAALRSDWGALSQQQQDRQASTGSASTSEPGNSSYLGALRDSNVSPGNSRPLFGGLGRRALAQQVQWPMSCP